MTNTKALARYNHNTLERIYISDMKALGKYDIEYIIVRTGRKTYGGNNNSIKGTDQNGREQQNI